MDCIDGALLLFKYLVDTGLYVSIIFAVIMGIAAFCLDYYIENKKEKEDR
jgi:hypothetical protein